jgi:hypothetical protein
MLRKIRELSILLCFILFLNHFIVGVCISSPVVSTDFFAGSWRDTFKDTVGIETLDNLKLSNGYIDLETAPTTYDMFNGINGDPPNSTLWEIIDDGYTIEIENNMLKTTVSPASASWNYMMARTNYSFSWDHNITWRQNLHDNSGGMYYHFFAFDGRDDSILLGINKDSVNDHHIYNYKTAVDYEFSSTSLTGWHNFAINFTDGYLEIFVDGVREWYYTFEATSIKYQFGTAASNQASTIYTDDIIIALPKPTGNLTSTNIDLPKGYTWDSLVINKTEFGSGNEINVTILENSTYKPIQGFINLTGTSIDISSLDHKKYPSIHLKAHFSSMVFFSPALMDWKVTWLDTIPPTTPSGFTVDNPHSGYSLILSWYPNKEPDFENYVIYYSKDNVTFNWLSNCSRETISFIHYGLSAGTTYYYKIASADKVPNQSPDSIVIQGISDLDYDSDGLGDTIDPDDDNDGIPDIDDLYPFRDINDMEITLDNLTKDVDDLRSWLRIATTNIVANINVTNITLHERLDELDAMINAFYNNLSEDLAKVLSDLQLHDLATGQNHTIIIALLNELLEGQIEKEKIAELREMLIKLADNVSVHDQSLANYIMNMVKDLDEFENETNRQIGIINDTLVTLDKLELILQDLEDLGVILDLMDEEIQDSFDERSTREEDDEHWFTIQLLLIILLILLIVILILTFVIITRIRINKTPKISDTEPQNIERGGIVKQPEAQSPRPSTTPISNGPIQPPQIPPTIGQ